MLKRRVVAPRTAIGGKLQQGLFARAKPSYTHLVSSLASDNDDTTLAMNSGTSGQSSGVMDPDMSTANMTSKTCPTHKHHTNSLENVTRDLHPKRAGRKARPGCGVHRRARRRVLCWHAVRVCVCAWAAKDAKIKVSSILRCAPVFGLPCMRMTVLGCTVYHAEDHEAAPSGIIEKLQCTPGLRSTTAGECVE